LSEQFYRISADEALARLRTDREQGLSEREAQARRRLHGANVLDERKPQPAYERFARQFKDLLIVVLIVASALAYYLGDFRGGTILLAIVIVNAAIGSYQEYKAERILELLRTLIKAKVIAIRDGTRREIEEPELVPGDIVVLQEGSAVPADIRLLETHELRTNDFILTGESWPQRKNAGLVTAEDAGLADQDNLAFFGTTVAAGNALGVVFATGMRTAIGDIARVSQAIQRDISPLQREIDTLAKTLTKLAGLIALTLFAANLLLRAGDVASLQLLVNTSLTFAIGVAAACVPQGLPAQISVALSLGIGRLAAKQAVVKRLSAVETLGSTTVICSDKTGTLTVNEMTIVRCWVDALDLEVTGEGYDPRGEIRMQGERLPAQQREAHRQFFAAGFLASNGRTHPPDTEHGGWYALGDPTEAAFTPLTIKAGLDPADLEARFPLLRELPFDSTRRRMTMVRKHEGRAIAYMKGSVASVLAACNAMQRGGRPVLLSEADRASIAAKGGALAAAALRVIALAYRDLRFEQSAAKEEDIEAEFVFAGLVAMLDPPRRGAREAVRSVRDAHIRLFMITGDDPATAQAIAARIGMEQGRVVTGKDLKILTDADLKGILAGSCLIFSRVSPQDKYRIVAQLKRMGEVVAVTGDGVNDTLSLKQADIGVAMGRGSDVAKEAAEIVLLDDNFGTLVTAIREGRTIFQNLERVIMSSITTNLGELSCVLLGFVGLTFGLPIPITAVQILAVDLIAELLPLMALTLDAPEPGLMQRPPRKLGAHIVSRRSLADLVFFGILMGGAGYFSFYMAQRSGASLGTSQSAAYVAIVLAQYANILSRRTARSIFGPYLLANRELWLALIVSLMVVLVLINVRSIGSWFGFEPLRLRDWLWPAAGAVALLLSFEIGKVWRGGAPRIRRRGATTT